MPGSGAGRQRGSEVPAELFERLTGEYLLLSDRPLRTAAADEAHRPMQQCRQPVLEPDHVDEVEAQPHQPGCEPGEPEPPDAGDRTEPRDRRHTALVLSLIHISEPTRRTP